jgi:hypothetical protein
MLLVFNHERHCHLYALDDHERNRRWCQKIDFATLNVILKRVITKVMVGYSESTLSIYCLETVISYSDDGETFYGPTQYYDVCHRLAGHVTKSLVIRTSITWIE